MRYAPETPADLIARSARYLYYTRGLSRASVREEIAKTFPDVSPIDRAIFIEAGLVKGEGTYEAAPKQTFVGGGADARWAKDYRCASVERHDGKWHIEACVGTIEPDGTHHPADGWYCVLENPENQKNGFLSLSEAEGTLRRILESL